MNEIFIRDRRDLGMVMHPSTKCVLAAMQDLRGKSFRNILDVGCGSGLLSLAAAQLWPQARLLASDINENAVQDATANLRGKAEVVRTDGFGHASIRARAPYDLVLCNLLAEILISVSTDVKSHLAPGGLAVLSGILAWKLPQVKEAYQALGFEIIEEISIAEWRALVIHLS